jgi:hypothetical protein
MNWFEGEFGEHNNDVGCRNYRTDDGLDTLVNQDLPPSSSPQTASVRPERMTLSDQSAASMVNSFSGTTSHVEYPGAVMEPRIKLPSSRIISVIDPNLGHPVAAISSAVTVSFAPADCIIVADDAGTE